MKIRTWRNFFVEGMHNIFRNRVMSLASIVAIMSALFILGVVLVVVLNLNHIAGDIESKIEITTFLKKDVSYNEIQSVQKQMEGWEGVYEVDFVSKDEALIQWKEELGDKRNLLDGYDAQKNPLPDKFILKISKPEYAEGVLANIRLLSVIEKINYSQEVVDTIGKIVRATRLIGFGIAALLGLISIIIINNTIKITVYSRRREINIMKYIGATDWYIRWPFVIEGLILGIFGAFLACGLLLGGYHFLLKGSGDMVMEQKFLDIFKLLPIEVIFYDIGMVFLLGGSIMGISASMISMHKHLKV